MSEVRKPMVSCKTFPPGMTRDDLPRAGPSRVCSFYDRRDEELKYLLPGGVVEFRTLFSLCCRRSRLLSYVPADERNHNTGIKRLRTSRTCPRDGRDGGDGLHK